MRLGRLSPLAALTIREVPSFAQWSAPLIDLNIGILTTFPCLTFALATTLVALAWRSPKRLRAPAILISLAALMMLLVGCSQIPNFNHGGTPGISRYGLWCIPLTLPIFAQCDVQRPPRIAWLGAIALVSCLWSARFYGPRIPEDYNVPTLLAEVAWTRYPSFDNPLPEIFGERVTGRGDEIWLPAATARCEKVLLRGDGREPRWPVPCPPTPLPSWCTTAEAICYANGGGDRYRFVAAPRQVGFQGRVGPIWTWTASSAVELRRMVTDVRWDELRIARFTDPAPMVRRFERIDWVYMLQSDRQFIVYLSHPAPRAVLRIETAAPMRGRIVDLDTGETLQTIASTPRFLAINVPAPRRDALVILTRADGKSTIRANR